MSEAKNEISRFFAKMRLLNAQMQSDQADIDRLTAETRAIAARNDSLLSRIEKQLDALRYEKA